MSKKGLEYLTDEEEAEFYKSQGFRDDLRKAVNEATWGKGLPKIVGENNTEKGTYDIVALFENGNKILLGYNKDGMSISVPNDYNNTTEYEGYWKESFTQKVTALTFEELIDVMTEKRELFSCLHKSYINKL